ncbi:isopeptide-forming domain-containing fimbrial protein [Bifidobacterium sp. ESL0682]|uniref:isopeptide-forming domain-containing fimbrial protein n=1 Tax=Bifidobacterium sp. ESL0682 TaxID=2983212 RepID=UPI0023F79E43|nr:isopeptide-forming domain-containing fimbrial protein [Bifidobacterium sp. ESL0682]WEV41882.1 isopeptide-forming domain-containing fimbrial protein [Bifidobacterium sp. ESL0682]
MGKTKLARLLASATALVAGATMFASTAMTASAVESQPDVDLTLKGETVQGRTYSAVKLGDYGNAVSGSGSIASSVEVSTVDNAAIKSSSSSALTTTLSQLGSADTFTDPIGYVASKWNTAGDTTSDKATAYEGNLRRFVANLWKESAIKSAAASSTITATGTKDNGAKFTMPNGVYLIVDTTADTATGLGEHTGASIPMLVSTTSPNAPGMAGAVSEINVKAPYLGKPDKTTDKPSHNVGDVVPFKISTTVPTYTDFDQASYKLIVHDQLSQGLTYQDAAFNAVVKIGDKTLAKGTDYTVTVPADGTKAAALTFDLSPYMQAQIAAKNYKLAGSTITISYGAVLNEDAISMAPGSVKNSANVEYTNDPNSSTEHNKTNTTEPGQTPIYTFGFDVEKVAKDTGEALPGTQFQISFNGQPVKFFDEGNGNYRSPMSGEATVDTVTVPAGGTIHVQGVESGTYTVKETKAVDGFKNMNTSFEAIIAPVYAADKTLTSVSYEGGKDVTWNLVSHSDNSSKKYTVTNVRSLASLPLTGAAGITMLVAFGVLLVAVGSGLYVGVRRNQRAHNMDEPIAL